MSTIPESLRGPSILSLSLATEVDRLAKRLRAEWQYRDEADMAEEAARLLRDIADNIDTIDAEHWAARDKEPLR